jgi:hypothetical protein
VGLGERLGVMKLDEVRLKNEIIQSFKEQGFLINPHLRPTEDTKDFYKKVHQQRKIEKIRHHKRFLEVNFGLAKKYAINGNAINPKKIRLQLREVRPNSLEAKLFFWWNLIWWSIPYERLIGRQLRFIIWDLEHDAPFGLLALQSAPLKQKIRDEALGITDRDRDYWVNMSLYAQRVGALPPYNELLGGKMVALSITANEIREAYRERYQNRESVIRKRILPATLLFITTTAAFGKSSMYERLRYKDEPVFEFLGYTSGSGTFHIQEEIYVKIIMFLKAKGVDTKRGYGTGPSRKLHLIETAFRLLGIPSFVYHNIQRGFYLFPNVSNLREVIQMGEKPQWYDRKFTELSNYWLERWALPRSERIDKWKAFSSNKFINSTEEMIASI